ncbi:hypothetical protein CBS101457_000597 [Exobasidium rhododendri]|nr:hypothetical protein CBS101457_000597 [Exobasidium rhododendri]
MSALQHGDKVLITGGTGWIGSHIAHEALAAGLTIKLAIRNEEKAKTLIEALEKIHGKGHIETVIVKDYGAENAYDEAITGVEGVIHAASDLTFSPKPDEVVPAVTKAYNSLFNAANSQKQIRRVILTSSSIALGFPNAGGKTTQHFDVHSWNDAALEKIKTSPDGVSVYAASKVLSERIAWDFVKNKKPNFVVTSINPNLNLGATVPGVPYLSSGTAILDAAKGAESFLGSISPQWHVDVEDVAKLHVIALTREDVKNERILAFGSRYNYNTIIDIIKKIKPDATTLEKREEWGVEDNTTVDVSRANELLKEQGGLRDLEYSIRGNLQGL